MTKPSIHSLTVETARDLLQGAGFRAELVADSATMPVLRSASNGVTFELRLFNPLREDKESFADAMFMAGLTFQGTVAPEFLNRWNSIKRFGRLYTTQGLLVLALDIFLQGGISPEHLRAQLDIWDRLIQELLTYARTAPAEAIKNQAAAGNSETQSGTSADAATAAKIPERESEMASPAK